MVFKGSGVALVTPFKKGNIYEIDYDKLRELVGMHIKNHTDAIIVCGTTGEASTMTDEEKSLVIATAKMVAAGRVPVIAGTGSNDTRRAAELSIKAEQLGADALLIVTPYYNKCTQKGLFLHYKRIAECVSIPIILYNVPSRTGVNILPKTVLELAKIPNIVGIKEASGNLNQIKEIIELTKGLDKDFAVYSGNDNQIYDVLDLGGDGVISVLANIRPKDTHKLCQHYFDGNKEKSKKIQELYQPLIKALFNEVNPIPIKTALLVEGYNVGELRLPLTKGSEETEQILKRELKKTEE